MIIKVRALSSRKNKTASETGAGVSSRTNFGANRSTTARNTLVTKPPIITQAQCAECPRSTAGAVMAVCPPCAPCGAHQRGRRELKLVCGACPHAHEKKKVKKEESEKQAPTTTHSSSKRGKQQQHPAPGPPPPPAEARGASLLTT